MMNFKELDMTSTARNTKAVGRTSGFTLIEVMIVVAIVAILSTVAYASYTNQVVKSRRAAAAGCLQELAQFMERSYTTNMEYPAALPNSQCQTDLATHYSFPAPNVNGRTYTLQANPEGGQASNDTGCATLGINQSGAKTVSGGKPVQDCW